MVMLKRVHDWRKINSRTEQRRREHVRRNLRRHNILPPHGEPMNEEQQEIYDMISRNDFSVWEKYCEENNIHIPNPEGKTTIKSYPERTFSREEHILNRAYENAKRRNLDFDLTIDDIVVPEKCPFLGCDLIFEYDKSLSVPPANYYTVDRINSELGYIKGNIQVLSWRANTMKSNATEEELISFSKGVLRQFLNE